MQYKTFIKARVTVPGVHQWPQAPDSFSPLREIHRHLFTFELEVETTDPNRGVEFLDAGRYMREAITAEYPSSYWDAHEFGTLSCEHLSIWMLNKFPGAIRCTVWEDGENCGGATRVPGGDF